jgi:hypothetical protein
LAWILVPVSAHAGSHVVYEGEDPGLAVARVAVAVSRPPGDFTAVDWPSHREGLKPALLGVGSLAECTGDATNAAPFAEQIKEAEGALNFMEHEKVHSITDAALQGLSCLAEPVDAAVVSRFHFLKGVVYMDQGDKPSAWASFQSALVIDPGLAWDENIPPDSKPVFIAAQAEMGATPPTDFTLVPAPGEARVWMDGKEVAPGTQTIPLVGNTHWLQWEDDSFHTAILTLEPGPQVGILLPSTLGEAPLYAVTDSTHHVQISALMASVGAPGDEIFVTTLGGVWRNTVGQADFEQLAAPTMPIPALESASPVELPVEKTPLDTTMLAARSLLYGGVGVAVLGGGLAYKARSEGMGIYGKMENAADNDAYDALVDPYLAAATQTQNMGLVAVAGIALAGAGFALDSPVAAAGWMSTQEAGVSLTWRR